MKKILVKVLPGLKSIYAFKYPRIPVDPFDLSSKFAQFSPRKNVDDNITERLESSMEERQKGLLNVTITPRSQLDKKLPCSITVPIPDEITEVGVREII